MVTEVAQLKLSLNSVALVGAALPGADRLEGLSAVVQTAPPDMPLEEALERAVELYRAGAEKTMEVVGRIIDKK